MVSQNEKNLDASQYINENVFEQESEKLFSEHWWLIGCESTLTAKGDYLCYQVGKAKIFVIRDDKGALKGFHNICRHRAGPIITENAGSCPGKLLVCQYHGWSYDFSGNLVNSHDQTSIADKARMGLKPVRVEVWNQMVFVSLSDKAPSLLQWLGPMTDKVNAFLGNNRYSYHDVIHKKAGTNWKCYGDNACEGYHVGVVHKTLGQTASNEKIDLHCESDGQYVRFDVTYSASEADQSRTGKGLWIYKYPGLLIHCSEFGYNAECVMPVRNNETRITRWFWTDQEAVSAASIKADYLIDSASQVIDEDIRICEQVYDNLESGFADPGPLSMKNEPGTIFFQQLVRDMCRTNTVS